MYYSSICDVLSVIAALNNRAFDVKSVRYNPNHQYTIDCWYESRKNKSELMLVIDPRVFSGVTEGECFATPLKGFRPTASGFVQLANYIQDLVTKRDGEVCEYANYLIDEGCTVEEAEAAGMAVRSALLFIADRICAMFAISSGKEGV